MDSTEKTESPTFFYDQLLEIMETAKANRSPQLKRQDKKGNSWYLSEKMVGVMLYVGQIQ